MLFKTPSPFNQSIHPLILLFEIVKRQDDVLVGSDFPIPNSDAREGIRQNFVWNAGCHLTNTFCCLFLLYFALLYFAVVSERFILALCVLVLVFDLYVIRE